MEMLQFLPNCKNFLPYWNFFVRLLSKCNKNLLRPPEKCIIMEGKDKKPSLSGCAPLWKRRGMKYKEV